MHVHGSDQCSREKDSCFKTSQIEPLVDEALKQYSNTHTALINVAVGKTKPKTVKPLVSRALKQ